MSNDESEGRNRRYGVARHERIDKMGEWVQLATRIPKKLRRDLRLFCVKADISLMEFVVEALAEKLKRDAKTRPER